MRTMDKGKPFDEQAQLQELINSFELGTNNVIRELNHLKSLYDAVLTTQEFSKVRYYIVRTSNTPDFLCSGTTQPEYDFAGNKLQSFSTTISNLLHHITFSIIATNSGGAIVFSWLDGNTPAQAFINSLHTLSDDVLPHAITRYAFEYFENLYISPSWWEDLDDTVKQRLIYRQLPETHPHREYIPNPLRDDGLRVVSWSIVNRETNVSF